MSARGAKWLAFGACAAAVVGAMVWVSLAALEVEARRDQLRVEGERQDRLELALWRMDATVTALLAGESVRPWYHYDAFYAEDDAFTASLARREAREVLVPSPLLDARSDVLSRYFKLHVQFYESGRSSSPQVPEGELLPLALRHGYTTEVAVTSNARILRQLDELIAARSLREALEEAAVADAAPAQPSGEAAVVDSDEWRRVQQRALQEFQFRTQNLELARRPLRSANRMRRTSDAGEVQGAFEPYLFPGAEGGASELIFARLVRASDGERVQGVWINWAVLQSELLASVRADLFPSEDVDLVHAASPPATAAASGELVGRLASLPATLVVGSFDPAPPSAWTTTRAALAVGWIAVLASLFAVALVLRAAIELGERRGRFAAAVTHELRTPLTTFCMYAEMLANDMVRGEDERRAYLRTLEQESRRLRRIVDNVLQYARVDGHAGAARAAAEHDAGELFDRLAPALERRAAESDATLDLAGLAPARGARVRADAHAVEEILLNLVDNACKYGGQRARVELSASSDARRLAVRVRDHGPGVPRGKEREVFAPYRRATGDEGSATPGIGLGLTLARGLARELGGDVRLVDVDAGAAFELTLPLAP